MARCRDGGNPFYTEHGYRYAAGRDAVSAGGWQCRHRRGDAGERR